MPSAPTHPLWVIVAEALSQDIWDGSVTALGTSTKKGVTGYHGILYFSVEKREFYHSVKLPWSVWYQAERTDTNQLTRRADCRESFQAASPGHLKPHQ